MPSRFPVFAEPEDTVLSLEVQARISSIEPDKPAEFRLLVRHFLERFFNNEMASADGEGKMRMIQAACAVGLPGFVMALYLYPMYHLARGHRPYWSAVSDHYFYVAYSVVALGVVTVFQWDFFFPNLLDVFVLSPLPVRDSKLFQARISAVALFLALFLFDSNFLAPLVLPAATDPPALIRFLAAHIVAVAMSGIFAATFVLTLQGLLLGILGEHLFRKISLLLQGLSITTLLTLLLLTPTVAGVLRGLINSRTAAVLYFPPFWFLGLYQRILEGPAAPPIFARLAETGFGATVLTTTAAMLSYPFAYRRRTRELIEGSTNVKSSGWLSAATNLGLSATPIRNPAHKAISGYIGQTLMRVQRHQFYLTMYGGLGLALMIACALRLNFVHGELRLNFSSDGLRAGVPISAFWTIAGLRTTFLSPADRRGAWIFRAVRGRPGLEQLMATKQWVLLRAILISLLTIVVVYIVAPRDLRTWRMIAVQLLTAIGLCLLLTDVFFLRVRTIPFTGAQAKSTTHLAFVITQYLGLFPLLIFFTLDLEKWMEANLLNILITAATIAAAHLTLRWLHQKTVAGYTGQIELDEDQEEFPQTLGLRY
jgi:hypothetical protein